MCGCRQWPVRQMVALSECLRDHGGTLLDVDLTGRSRLNEECVCRMLPGLGSLRKLAVSLQGVGNPLLTALGRHCGGLEVLALEDCTRTYTASGLEEMCAGLGSTLREQRIPGLDSRERLLLLRSLPNQRRWDSKDLIWDLWLLPKDASTGIEHLDTTLRSYSPAPSPVLRGALSRCPALRSIKAPRLLPGDLLFLAAYPSLTSIQLWEFDETELMTLLQEAGPRLTRLDLGQWNFVGSSPAINSMALDLLCVAALCPGLQQLSLTNVHCSPSYVAQWPALRAFKINPPVAYVSKPSLLAVIRDVVRGAPGLQTLHVINGGDFLSVDDVPGLCGAQLQEVKLFGPCLPAQAVHTLATRCPRLRRLRCGVRSTDKKALTESCRLLNPGLTLL